MAELMEEAPGSLETVRRFVNTLHDNLSKDEIASPEGLAGWLADHGLVAKRAQVRPADVRRAHDVREALRGLMLANNGAPADDGAVATLNTAASRARVRPAFADHSSWELEPGADGVDRALGELLAIVFRSMSDGSWQRLKACGDPGCAYAFYDHSKNRSGRWCDMASCGNRAKARAFRERERQRTKTDAGE
jgi:predicted RNA-binding Zn ribbon-like protein